MGECELGFGAKQDRIQGILSTTRGDAVEGNLGQGDTALFSTQSPTIMGGIRSRVESIHPRVPHDSNLDNISRTSNRGR